jgi:peptide/nickel transport system permease protein
MLTYTIRRLLMLIPMLVIISFLIFCGMEAMPGDAVSFMASPDALANISPERLEALRESLGLNDPFLVRYMKWFVGVLHGNFGYSLASALSIREIVFARLPATLELSIAALLISTILGNILGIYSALRKGTIGDNALTVAGMLGLSIPEFFFGLVSLVVFAINLGWLPVGGRISSSHTSYWEHLPNLIMPASVLGLIMTAGVMRYARASMLDSINKDFIRTARSKGIPEWRVNFVHGFRAALTPIVVLIGFRLPMLIGGSVVIEQVFQWPGLGTELVKSVRAQNYPLVMMITLLSVTVTLVASVLVDLLTAVLDPRIRLE